MKVFKQQQNKKIPKLRFSAFANASADRPEFGGEWEEKKLGEVATFLKGKGISKDDIAENGKNKCIRYGELYTEYNEIIDEIKSRTNVSKDNAVLSEENDILMPTSDVTPDGLATASALNEAGVILGGDILIIRSSKILNKFFSYYVAGNKKDIMRLVTGVTVYHIYGSDLATLKINFPSLPEQQKIAGFLSAVDERIGVLQKKREALVKYKKGIMQKIFPAKGEKVPEIRFKNDNGKDFPEWKEKRLGEVCKNYGGTSLEKYVSEYGEYKFISIGNYTREGKYNDDSKRIVLNKITKTKLLNKGDLVMVLNDKTSTGDIIGSTILIDSNNTYIYNQRSERLVFDNKIIKPLFIWFYLNSSDFRRQIVRLAQGGTQIYVNFSAVKKIKIKIPSLPEQQKIADFLSAIDKKNELLGAQTQKMQEWKRGLMRGLFV
jgi:type I restriction enzyme S subunit